MTVSLEPNKQHDHQQASDVQARGGRIEADVTANGLARERFSDLVGVLMEQTAPS
jgi:hypothetical protein